MKARLLWTAAVAASAILVIACTGGPAVTAAPSPTPRVSPPPSTGPSAMPSVGPSTAPSAGPATVVLKVTSEGGFINPSASLNALPIVEVLTDGSILTPGAVPAIAPSPLLPTLTLRNVGAAGAAAIVAAIKAARLDQPATGGPGIPGDSGTEIFSVTIDGQTTDTRLAGSGPGVGGPGVGGPGAGGSADPGKAAAFDLLSKLLDPAETWGAASASPTPYAPLGYRVFVIPGAPQADPATPQFPVAWPLATSLDQFGTPAVPDRGIAGLRQGAVLGADAARLGPILAAATVQTPFTSAGASYTLSVRPLLPDELGG